MTFARVIALDLYRDVGAKLAGDLVCRSCRKREQLTKETAARYLEHGWPVCCGETMELVTSREDVKPSR